MTTSPAYDALVERLRREREGSFKTKAGRAVDYKISDDGNGVEMTITGTVGMTLAEIAKIKVTNVPKHLQPKRKGGWPKGKKRKAGK